MHTEKDLIAWKTDAWKDRGMVAGYAQRMVDASGAIMLKNRIEVAAFARYARGKRILDVGVGTGRASLPLARGGFDVTGVDSSQAMLDKTRELAGETPIELQQGDVANLPVGDASFDTVMALNTIGHFPHWQPILREWRRAVKPGGRLVFDMFSLDHDIAYALATGKDEAYGITFFAPADARGYYLRLKVEELVQFATDEGLRVGAIQPYSVLIGSAGYNRFLEKTPLSGKSWDRLLTWVGADEKLFAFLSFLEEEIVGRLTTRTGCRYVVVLDNEPDAAANADWLKRNAELNAALEEGLTTKTLDLAHIDAGVRDQLAAHLDHAPNRFAFARILLAGIGSRWPVDVEALAGPHAAECRAVIQRGQIDAALTALLETFHEDPALKDALRHNGVPVANAFEYDLMIALLDKTIRAFDRPLSEPVR